EVFVKMLVEKYPLTIMGQGTWYIISRHYRHNISSHIKKVPKKFRITVAFSRFNSVYGLFKCMSIFNIFIDLLIILLSTYYFVVYVSMKIMFIFNELSARKNTRFFSLCVIFLFIV